MKHEFKKYLYIGFTAFMVIFLSILVFFGIFRISEINRAVKAGVRILMPVIYGLVIGYLLTPVYNFFFKLLKSKLHKVIPEERKRNRLSSGLSIFISLILMLLVIASLLALVVPQVFVSIAGIVESMPKNMNRLSEWLQEIFKNYPEFETVVMNLYTEAVTFVENWVRSDLLPSLEVVVTGVSTGIISVVSLFKNIIIGIIVAVYVLASKNQFNAQAKKIVYSLFRTDWAEALIKEFQFANEVFGGFIIGKLLDSLIIGIICFVCMSFLKMPYVMLISVIVGVTNIIPFFGPFVGAIPSALIILMVSPRQCLYFLIFILLLQQFDGNILGPKILGDSTGLSSFWVLFAILFFGGVWGFVGMIVGVPLFAVIYHVVSQLVNMSLKAKKLSTMTDDYRDLPDQEEEMIKDKK